MKLAGAFLKGQEWKFDQNKLQIVQNLWAEKTEIELFFENQRRTYKEQPCKTEPILSAAYFARW